MNEEKLIKLVVKFENFSLLAFKNNTSMKIKNIFKKYFSKYFYGNMIKIYLFNRYLKKHKYVILKENINNVPISNLKIVLCKSIQKNGRTYINYYPMFTNYNFILVIKEDELYEFYFKDKNEAAKFNLEN